MTAVVSHHRGCDSRTTNSACSADADGTEPSNPTKEVLMSEAMHRPRSSSLPLNRRQLLRVVGTSAGALFFAKVLAGCQNPKGSPPSGLVGGIKTTDLKLNSLQILSSNVVVAEDSNGIYAMSAICTHAGCVLDDGSQTIGAGLSCPCHGSTFDGGGNALARRVPPARPCSTTRSPSPPMAALPSTAASRSRPTCAHRWASGPPDPHPWLLVPW